MSAHRTDAGRGSGWDDERILEWILSRGTLDSPASGSGVSPASGTGVSRASGFGTSRPSGPGPSDPGARERMAELTAFLSQGRTALRDEQDLQGTGRSPGREAELTERVLARTTREDLRWRGDLTLVGGYLRERLSRSVALRFAAASLLLHLAVLPVLAYYVFLAPEKGIKIDVISWEKHYPAPPFPEERAEPEAPVIPCFGGNRR